MPITSVCRSGSPKLYKGNSLDSIALVSRKSRPEIYELTEKRIWSKENWQWYSLLVHRGLSIGNGFEQECVDLGVRKEKTTFACNSSTNVRRGQQQ